MPSTGEAKWQKDIGWQRIVAFQAGLKERTVVVEFPSFELALATFQSEAYQEALAVLGDGAERDARVVAGLED